jgi:histidine ammonia-lyase
VTVTLTGNNLSLDDLVAVARGDAAVELAASVAERVARGRAIVEDALEGNPVYGLTTGVGVRQRTRVDPRELALFNRRLILEHRVGQGDAAPRDVVRAQLLLVANGFARGTSGVRLELLEHVVERLNAGVVPEVRLLGSIGMTDLPANADLADGILDGFELAAKEGLALLGSNAFSTAFAALALVDAQRLLVAVDVAAAFDLEALAGNVSPLYADASFARLLEGSYLWDAGAARNLQDPLSFRCIPQVREGAREAFAFAQSRIERELNRSQENPLVLLDEGRLISVGAFDALPLSQALDVVRVGLAPVLTSASERTIKLLQSPVTGLPEGLAAEMGLAETGLSEFALPAQALAVEAKLLAQPVSIETGSTSHHEGIEDRITLAPLSARRLAQMVELGERLVAIELVVAAQAIDLRGRPRLGVATSRAYEAVRGVVPMTAKGEPPPQDLEPVRQLVREGAVQAG